MASGNDATNDVLSISSRRDGDVVVITLAGELDLHGAGRFDAEVGRQLTPPLARLEVDAGELEFVDSSGLRSLMLARANAETAGATFRVRTASAAVSRVIDMAGLGEVLLPGAASSDGDGSGDGDDDGSHAT
jgi:anti-sigma B factor antagonist/stage II sporulation protein AA (anti-sigma F factor antagonist)